MIHLSYLLVLKHFLNVGITNVLKILNSLKVLESPVLKIKFCDSLGLWCFLSELRKGRDLIPLNCCTFGLFSNVILESEWTEINFHSACLQGIFLTSEIFKLLGAIRTVAQAHMSVGWKKIEMIGYVELYCAWLSLIHRY